jgi:gamma-glutamyltranspeptidase/glutathione hydrolase
MKRIAFFLSLIIVVTISAQNTQKPVLHGKHWMAITGKPLGATAGAMIFSQGGNAVDAACAMLAATSTMWDVLSWGGETQALIYNPKTGKVIGINALGVAPSGATAEYYKKEGYKYPPRFGPLAAVTPGTPGGLMTMLAEYGKMSLKEVLAPAMDMAQGYPMEAQTANRIEGSKVEIKKWSSSKRIFLTNAGEEFEAPKPGEIFVQTDLYNTLTKLVEAEQNALGKGKTREEAIYAAYDRFYKGDIADAFVKGVKAEGGLITKKDLANWEVYIEEPVKTSYKDIDVYKLTSWVQSPVMLQSLNMMEKLDVKSMGYNSVNYIHALYQVMNLAFADRDFYYGDPYFPPEEPMEGLLSKDYAEKRMKEIDWKKNNPDVKPGNPYEFQDGDNPFMKYIDGWTNEENLKKIGYVPQLEQPSEFPSETTIYTGTTSIQAADEEGWVVSITPSGGWVPAVIAGNTGIGLSQRAQSFVLEESENPYNVIEPGKRPRATLTPTLALKDGKPFISFAVQGGDSQDQNLLQFFLNMVEFDMNVQEAAEAANINSYQMRGSFDQHVIEPGKLLIREDTPDYIRKKLRDMGYTLQIRERTSGPINAIFFDWENGSFWGGSSNFGEDYGIGW